MDCKVCFEKYDKLEHKPIVIIPCAHTFCLRCLYDLKTKVFICPICRQEIKNEKPNYDLLELLDLNLVIDSNASLKREIKDRLKQIDEFKLKFKLNSEKLIQENQIKITEMKREINNKTNEIITNLKQNQEKLIYKADNLHNEYQHKINSFLNELNESNDKDLNQLDSNELTKLKDDLDKLKQNLETKIIYFNELTNKYVFKSNQIDSINLLGDLIDIKSPHQQMIQDKMKHDFYFSNLTKNKYLNGEDLREFLFKIWNLSDLDQDGKLDENEFSIACCLIQSVLTNGINSLSIQNSIDSNKKYLDYLKSKTNLQLVNELANNLNKFTSHDLIISSANDKLIKIWNVKTGKCVNTLEGSSWAVFCLRLVSKNILISGSYDKTIKIWNLISGKCINNLEGHTSSILCIEAQNDLLVSGSNDKTIKLWNIRNGKCLGTLEGHRNYVKCVKLLNDAKLVSGSGDKTIKIWNITTRECLNTLRGHSSYPWCLKVVNNYILISASFDKTFKIWNIDSGVCLNTIDAHLTNIYSLEVALDKLLITGSDKLIKIWDIKTGSYLKTLLGHKESVNCMIVFKEYLITGSNDKTIKIWNYESGDCVKTLEGHSSGICCLQIFNNGLLVSGSEDGVIKMWNIDSFSCTFTFEGHCNSAIKCLELARN